VICILLVDVHAHLDHERFLGEIDGVIERARKAGVKRIITNGLDHKTNLKSLELAMKYDIVEAALGMYPEDALETEDESKPAAARREYIDIDKEIEFIKKSKPVALGEVGLDFKHGKDKERQILVFKKFISLSKEMDIPLIVHSRGAEEVVVNLLEESGAKKVVMHCFGGRLSLVKRIEKLGYFFSIPPIIVRSTHFQKIVETIPISHLLTETDAPYLSPFQAKRNEPAFVEETIKKIAEIKGTNPEETANMIFNNYQRIFPE
jgi:TatD DNase family protein